MSLDFSGLGDLAQNRTKAEWEPLRWEDLGHGTVLAFDQSLTATGAILLHNDARGARVYIAEKWSPVDAPKSVLTDLRRGAIVYRSACAMMRRVSGLGNVSVVHESPPNMAALKGKGSPVSSLMAAQALWCAAEEVGVELTMLGAMPAKKLVCGNSKATKPEAHAALKQHCLPWIEDSEKVTNEAHRDALMVALLKLVRDK